MIAIKSSEFKEAPPISPPSTSGFENISLPDSNHTSQLCRDDQLIEAVLDGVAPANLRRVETGVSNMLAYQSSHYRYIRSLNQIIDPDCTCRIYGVDNLNVCKQPLSISAILYVDRDTDEFGTLAFDQGV